MQKAAVRTLDDSSHSEAEGLKLDAGGLGAFGRVLGGQRLVHCALGTDAERLGGSGL